MLQSSKISLKCPAFLQKGDVIGIVALASKLDFEDLLPSIAFIENNWGLQVIVGESVKSSFHNFAGEDAIRLRDFQEMIDNPEIKAVFSARGGYGCSRIIDDVDFSKFIENPKWIIGFSDITVLHGYLQNMGFQSIHGPMPRTFTKPEASDSVAYLNKLLFGKPLVYSHKHTFLDQNSNRVGKAKGEIIGGNLCILAHGIGSRSEIDTRGKILFIEDIEEYRYNIDRMMVQLKRAGKLDQLAGLIVGHFSDSKEGNVPFGKSDFEIIADHVVNFDYPVSYGFPIGHEDENWAIPCGRVAELIVENTTTKLTFAEEIIHS